MRGIRLHADKSYNFLFEELYSLDAETMSSLGTVHGLVFLFKWRDTKDDRPTAENYQNYLFFAQQMISNACAHARLNKGVEV